MISTSPELPYARIYGGPLEDFVRRRDALVRELRSAGDRDAAKAVKALRKPSRVAWALDQGAITARDSFDALADAAAALVQAQSSGGDARAAMATLRGAVRSFAEAAAAAAGNAGHRVEPGALMGTVHAVLGRQESFEQLRAGCLVDVPEAGGLDALAALPVPPAAPTSAAPADVEAPGARRRSTVARAAVEAAESALAKARGRLAEARAQSTEAEARLTEAEDRVRQAESEARAARRLVERARAEAESLVAAVSAAEAALDEARQRAAAT